MDKPAYLNIHELEDYLGIAQCEDTAERDCGKDRASIRHDQQKDSHIGGKGMALIDRDKLLDWLEDERDVCLYHGNFAEAREASYIQKHVMEIGGMNDKGGNEDE